MKSWRDFWKVHPAADVFPLMDADALQKLADDIEANGLKVPVERRLTANGVYVIDGRNRLDALELAGVQLVDDKGGWLHPEVAPRTYCACSARFISAFDGNCLSIAFLALSTPATGSFAGSRRPS